MLGALHYRIGANIRRLAIKNYSSTSSSPHTINSLSVEKITAICNSSLSKIDPVIKQRPAIYNGPGLNDSINLYFGYSQPSKLDNTTELELYDNTPINENIKKPAIQAHKYEVVIRKKKMKKHRLLRRRIKYANEIRDKNEKAAELKDERIKIALKRVWENSGLKTEPEILNEVEKKQLEKEWRKEGVWTRALSENEIQEYMYGPPKWHLRVDIPDSSVWDLYQRKKKDYKKKK